MRKPTLNERITIKGLLRKKGVPPAHLVGVTTFPPLLSIWYRCFGKPMSEYWMYT